MARRLAPQLESLEKRQKEIAAVLERRFQAPAPGWGFHSLIQESGQGEYKIDIVLDRPRDIEQMAVVPAKAKSLLRLGDEPGYGFPRRFSVEVSPNESAGPFRTVWEWSAESQGEARPALHTAIEERHVRTIRFVSHEHYVGLHEGKEFFAVALAEFAAFSHGLNVCLNARVRSDGHYQTEHWDDAFLVDGRELSKRLELAKREGPLGYRSAAAESSEAERELNLELAEAATLGEMRLYPAFLADPGLPDEQPYCLPRQIVVQFANDQQFSHIHEFRLMDAAAVTRLERRQGVLALFPDAATPIQLPPIQARFMRLRMSALRPAPRRICSICEPEGIYAALAEIELLDTAGKNLAQDARVVAKPEVDPADLHGQPLLVADGDTGPLVFNIVLDALHADAPDLLDLTNAKVAEVAAWKSLWRTIALGGVCFCIALTAGMTWYYRARRESFAARKFETVRQQIANDLHDDVGGNLGAIRMLSQAVAESPPDLETKEDLLRISALASETANMMRDIVWLIDGAACTLQEMLQRMELVAENLLAGTEHSIEVRCEAKRPERRLPGEFRRHMLLALKEALNNSVRHSGADHVSVLIWANDRSLQFRVADNGKGMQPNGEGGRGLKSLQDRAKALKGELKIETQAGQGVTVDFQANDLKG